MFCCVVCPCEAKCGSPFPLISSFCPPLHYWLVRCYVVTLVPSSKATIEVHTKYVVRTFQTSRGGGRGGGGGGGGVGGVGRGVGLTRLRCIPLTAY